MDITEEETMLEIEESKAAYRTEKVGDVIWHRKRWPSSLFRMQRFIPNIRDSAKIPGYRLNYLKKIKRPQSVHWQFFRKLLLKKSEMQLLRRHIGGWFPVCWGGLWSGLPSVVLSSCEWRRGLVRFRIIRQFYRTALTVLGWG